MPRPTGTQNDVSTLWGLPCLPSRWALRPGRSVRSAQSRPPARGSVLGLGAVVGVAGLVASPSWGRVTSSPMPPPRLITNRPFVGLNVATLFIYTGLSIMFFLLSFDLVDRRGLSPTSAGL